MSATVRAVLSVHGLAKKKYRATCDIATAYGIGDYGRLDYEAQFGLWLLVPRAETRHASRIMHGIGMALADNIGRDVWAALADTDDEATAMETAAQIHQALREA